MLFGALPPLVPAPDLCDTDRIAEILYFAKSAKSTISKGSNKRFAGSRSFL